MYFNQKITNQDVGWVSLLSFRRCWGLHQLNSAIFGQFLSHVGFALISFNEAAQRAFFCINILYLRGQRLINGASDNITTQKKGQVSEAIFPGN